MKTYIPQKHYQTFWKRRLYKRAYGGKSAAVDLMLQATAGKVVVESFHEGSIRAGRTFLQQICFNYGIQATNSHQAVLVGEIRTRPSEINWSSTRGYF